MMEYKRGQEEDSFLRNLNVSLENVEIIGAKGTQIFVWHTKTEYPNVINPRQITNDELKFTNLGKLCEKYNEQCLNKQGQVQNCSRRSP